MREKQKKLGVLGTRRDSGRVKFVHNDDDDECDRMKKKVMEFNYVHSFDGDAYLNAE